jgi:hypothetical protein
MTTLSLLLLGCAARLPVDASSPILPALEAPIYAAAPYAPADPLVQKVAARARGLALDESLSAAAAAVGLADAEGAGVDGAVVTWAAFAAGWPHPVQAIGMERVAEGHPPGEGFLEDLEAASEQWPVAGLARARGRRGDTWVLLLSAPAIELGPFPRELGVGETFALPLGDTGDWTDLQQLAIGPDRIIHDGPVVLDQPGEWVVELWGTGADGDRRLAQFPLYVGLETPADGPFVAPVRLGVEDLEGEILASLNELRSLEEVRPVTADTSLALAARAGLAAPGRGAAVDKLGQLGFSWGAELACRGETVTDCLDDLWWSVSDRQALLHPELRLGGVAARSSAGSVTIVVALGVE